MSAHSRKPV